ncbi:YciI family protein [Actinomycetospora sp. TBRC 11914]|uniref:YciI family protein n=1 Tax=Actinomycetospora sp. TBRC 11914 TaxID=2729387 RepID=UPI00145F0889|nr:YciI family protein [Actinomycetospora sp. TBRC 11914]NMO89592.1 YciI family protein [Actinomycetospora sp. TBRC 11914]
MARYMLVLTYDEATALATPPDPAVFEEMGRFNAAMVDAGVLLAGEGLAPSSQGAVLTFPDGEGDGDGPTVSDGPFTEARELIGGFWILKVDSLAEAVSWARRAPFRQGERIEVRRVTEAEDFEGLAPEGVLEQEAELRERAAQQHGG